MNDKFILSLIDKYIELVKIEADARVINAVIDLITSVSKSEVQVVITLNH